MRIYEFEKYTFFISNLKHVILWTIVISQDNVWNYVHVLAWNVVLNSGQPLCIQHFHLQKESMPYKLMMKKGQGGTYPSPTCAQRWIIRLSYWQSSIIYAHKLPIWIHFQALQEFSQNNVSFGTHGIAFTWRDEK